MVLHFNGSTSLLHLNGAAFAVIVTKMIVTNYLPVTPGKAVPGGVDDVLWLSA
jgi:hypothetical protein